MSPSARTYARLAGIITIALALAGCATPYDGIVRPVPQLSILSPELEDLTSVSVDTYLKANVRPVFPSVLAIAKLASPYAPPYSGYGGGGDVVLQTLRGDEADGWRKLCGLRGRNNAEIISQVQFISPMLVSGKPTLKPLRDAAALLHAPLLLVCMQVDRADEGYNEAAIAYWSIVGLFVVPGNTVGHYSVCQAVLVDTRSGFILATSAGEDKREEKVLAGAVEIARRRTANQAWAQAALNLQADARQTLVTLASVSAETQP